MRRILFSLAFLLTLSVSLADEPVDCEENQDADCEAHNTTVEPVITRTLGGPDQVENRLDIDSNQVTPMFPSDFARGYFDWKDRIKENNGVGFGGDYSFAYLKASDSPGEDDALGGMYRMFGIPPGSLGFELGYAGIFLPPFSDQGTRLTNLYWRQRMKGGNLVFVGGFVDVTDYMDVYMLASPWTGYFNFAFSTGSASVPVPNEGLGLALGGYLNDNLYMIAGFADSNSDPAKPGDGFDTFFNDHEFFEHFEIGWNSTRETAFLNNAHLTLWHADEREAAATPDGWGANISFSRSVSEHWIPFIRAGYAEDGGSLLEKTLSAGFVYQTVPGGNQLSIAYNWGKPNDSTWGPDLDDQHTLEVFYRIQLWKEVAITPDIQYIRNPALNPDDDSLWVFGLRGRLAF